MKMQRGDIVIVIQPSFLNQLRRMITGRTFDHISLAISSTMLLEPLPVYGVTITDIKDRHRYQVFRVKGVTEDQLNQVVGYALNRVGKRYDYRSVWTRLKLKLQHWIHTGFTSQGCWMCRDVILNAYRKVGIDLLHNPCEEMECMIIQSQLLERIETVEV